MDKPVHCFIHSLCLIVFAICLNMEISHFMNNLEAIDAQLAIESPAYDSCRESSIDSEGNDCTPPVVWVVLVATSTHLAAPDAATSIPSIPSAPILPPPKSL
jgi:hypothetical protein